MAVRRLPPVNLKDGEADPSTEARSAVHRGEIHHSIDEELWRAEVRQTKHMGLGYELLTHAARCLSDFMPLVELQEGTNQLHVSKMLKDLNAKIAKAGILNPTNLTPELERTLFLGAVTDSLMEYNILSGDLSEHYESVYLPVARRVVVHYWHYEHGSVLSSDGSRDIEISFIDIDGEVKKIAKAEKISERDARLTIMDRALHACRVNSPTSWIVASEVLPFLKKADPARFKHVTTLGVIPDPEDSDTETDEDDPEATA